MTVKRTVVGLLACNVKMSSSKPKLKVRILDEMFKKNKLHTLTVQTTNSIFDSFRTDIGDSQAFLDEVARWKTRWNMVDGQKPQHYWRHSMSQTKTCTVP